MDTPFKHELALLSYTGACSPLIHGLIRKDETAAIFSPHHARELKTAYKVRHFKSTYDVRDYVIKECYRDKKRPIGKWLIKPVVCKISKITY